MGLMRFQVPERERVTREAIQRCYVTGLDYVPTPAHKSWDGEGALRIEREIDESGCFHILWDVEGHGLLLLSTASLMERQRPYLLPLELARGTVNRLRIKTSLWKSAGLKVDPSLAAQIDQAVKTFIQAATSQDQPQVAAQRAEASLRIALDAIDGLSQQYADQVLDLRQHTSSPLSTLLAGNLGEQVVPENLEPMYDAAFNSAAVPLNWSVIQPEPNRYDWSIADHQLKLCRRHRAKVIAGPLIRPDRQCLPDWVERRCWEDDWFAAQIHRYVAEVVKRYKGQVHLWHCSAAANLPSERLSDQQRVQITVTALEATRRYDPRTPVIVSFDQPWAEYAAEQPGAVPPTHFAEMLIRAELGLSGIGLELNLGYWPDGSLPRDVLEIGQLIDSWSLLGLPLIPILSIPSACETDVLASRSAARPIRSLRSDCPSMDSQKRWVERLLPTLLAKQSVQAIVWNQVLDSTSHRFAHGGLFDAGSKPKPSLSSIIALRRDYLP